MQTRVNWCFEDEWECASLKECAHIIKINSLEAKPFSCGGRFHPSYFQLYLLIPGLLVQTALSGSISDVVAGAKRPRSKLIKKIARQNTTSQPPAPQTVSDQYYYVLYTWPQGVQDHMFCM